MLRLLRADRLSRRLRSGGSIPALVVVLALFVAASQTDNLPEVLRQVTAERIRAHLAFLSDDLLEGRAPGTRGGRIAARYIAAHFQRAGLQPPAGGWLQPVPLVGWRPDPLRTSLRLTAGSAQTVARYPDESVLWSVGGAPVADVEGPLVFVGYGVQAPEYDWDDFGDADLRGRILLFLAGDPPSTPSEPDRFEGGALSGYGRWTYKLEEAARRGAAGALIIHSPAAGYDWSVVVASWTGEQFYAAGDPAVPPPVAIEGWVRPDVARAALATAGLSLDDLQAAAGRRDFRPIQTGLVVSARAHGATRRLDTANVIGIVPGSDPLLRDDPVVYTAHYDHLGIGPAQDGDSVYNGAYDNASGVSVLLELATAFGALRPAPRRSIVFVATGAEEAGLLGARRYVADPVLPIRRTAAVINIDGANLWGETSDIAAVGAERSTLGEIAERRARDLGLRLAPERAPDKGLFFRSDHFPFALAGVPALYVEHGLDFRGRPPGWGTSTLIRYEAERYHRPADGFDPAFDLAGAVQQTRFALLIGYDVARTDSLPRYTDGSPFARARSGRTGR